MAEAWTYLTSKKYAGSANKSGMIVTIEYDKASITPTSITLRGRGQATYSGWSYHTSDSFFITDKDGTFSRLVYRGGTTTKTDADAYISTSFTITKDKYAKSFNIPEIWICNDGQHHSSSSTYTDTNWRGHAVYEVGGSRDSYKTIMNAGGSTLTTDVYATDGTSPTLYIRDNGNNTATIYGKLGSSGNCNSMLSASVMYTTNGTEPSIFNIANTKFITVEEATDEESFTTTINITSACIIKAVAKCTYNYNSATSSRTASINYYIKPGNPGKPYLVDTGEHNSFKNGRLTLKKNWNWMWPLATAGNTSDYNKIRGYRLRFYVNNKSVPMRSSTNGAIISTQDNSDLYYDRTLTTYPMPMTISYYSNIEPGNEVKLSVQAYSTNGRGEKLLSTVVTSDVYTVQNAGVVNVKTADGWKEGQVYVKTANGWKEAETVNVKTADGWKESQ